MGFLLSVIYPGLSPSFLLMFVGWMGLLYDSSCRSRRNFMMFRKYGSIVHVTERVSSIPIAAYSEYKVFRKYTRIKITI